MSLRCRVVRSLVYRYAVWPSGEHDLLYRTGLEFIALGDESRQLITEHIDSLKPISRPGEEAAGMSG